MAELKDLLQSGDWKSEKHVPVIDCAETFKKSETIIVTIAVGREIPHPNTTAHHIQWLDLYFLPDGEKFSYQIGRCEFYAHGASIQGPDTSTIAVPRPRPASSLKRKSPARSWRPATATSMACGSMPKRSICRNKRWDGDPQGLDRGRMHLLRAMRNHLSPGIRHARAGRGQARGGLRRF